MNKKLMRQLADVRPPRLDPGPGQRADPDTFMVQPRLARRRPVRRLVLAGMAAAVVAGVVFVSTQDTAPAPVTTAQPPAPPKSARELLLVAAENSAASSATSGRYWVLRDESGNRMEVGPPGRRYHIMLRHSQEMWLATRPGDESLSVGQHLGAAPAGPEDVAAWRADGSPSRWPIPSVDGTPSGEFYEAAAGQRYIRHMEGATTDNNFLLGGNHVSLAELAALPTDPAALKTWLVQRFTDLGLTEPETYALFWSGKSIVMDLPVTPHVRAAAYRMMADLDGVAMLGEVTDQRGRSGMAVAYTHDGDAGQSEFRLIIDLGTGQALAQENRTGSGELTDYTLVDGVGFRDTAAPATP